MKDILVVHKKSLYELYQASEDKAVQDYVQNKDDLLRLEKSHKAQKTTLEQVLRQLEQKGIAPEVIYRAELSTIKNKDLVITVGGDGTLLEVSHYVKDTPILGVNSDPGKSVGFFSCATKDNFSEIMAQIDSYQQTKLQRLQIKLDDKNIPELVLNDLLLAHRNPAAMTRYEMVVDNDEIQNTNGERGLRSSGLVICTAAGSTAWMYEMGGMIMPLDSRFTMQYHERDQRESIFGLVEKEIKMRSLTREGFVYVDGEHLKYPFGLGSEIVVSVGRPLNVVGNLEEKRKKYIQQ